MTEKLLPAVVAVAVLLAGCGSSGSSRSASGPSASSKTPVTCESGVKATPDFCRQAEQLVAIARHHGPFPYKIVKVKTGDLAWDCLMEPKHHALACGAEKTVAVALISSRLI